MSRADSPYVVGDFWLDKRRDRASPEIWQIARYAAGSRSVIYLSTKCRSLDDAKPKIHAHEAAERAKQKQSAADAKVIPQLILYIKENKGRLRSVAQTRSSVRAFIGFLMQDSAGLDVTFTGLSKPLWQRFIKWRMGPHFYAVQWDGKTFTHESNGVSGEGVKRNLDDIRAGLNYAVDQERVPMAPRVPSVEKRDRSPARDTRLTIAELGAIVGYAREDVEARRWLLLMIGTACRPDAALAFDPVLQDRGDLLDLHPPAWPRTDKHNPIVPVIAPLRPVIDDWKETPHRVAKSRKRWWRTMRRALALPENVIPKTIRHTIATELRKRGVPGAEISGVLGHHDPDMKRTSSVYAKYDPAYLAKAARALTKIFREVETAADKWSADHLRTKVGNGLMIVVAREKELS